jgi:hypothetical protein
MYTGAGGAETYILRSSKWLYNKKAGCQSRRLEYQKHSGVKRVKRQAKFHRNFAVARLCRKSENAGCYGSRH